jgi:hypothetical protein
VALSPRVISHLRMTERAGKRLIGTMRDRQDAGVQIIFPLDAVAQVISVLRGTTQGLQMKGRAGKRSIGMMWNRQGAGAQEIFTLDAVAQVIFVLTTESRIARRMLSQRADVSNDKDRFNSREPYKTRSIVASLSFLFPNLRRCPACRKCRYLPVAFMYPLNSPARPASGAYLPKKTTPRLKFCTDQLRFPPPQRLHAR